MNEKECKEIARKSGKKEYELSCNRLVQVKLCVHSFQCSNHLKELKIPCCTPSMYINAQGPNRLREIPKVLIFRLLARKRHTERK
jgi:hypothetical protein